MRISDHLIAVVIPFPWDRGDAHLLVPDGWSALQIAQDPVLRAHLDQKYHAHFMHTMHAVDDAGKRVFVPDAPRAGSVAEVEVALGQVEVRSCSSGVAMLTLFFELKGPEMTLDHVDRVAAALRDPATVFDPGQGTTTLGQRVEDLLTSIGADPAVRMAFGPNFKVFTNVVVDDDPWADPMWNERLFELATGLPLGGMSQQNAPTQHYMASTLAANGLHVFTNWRAIALFDTFTRLAIRSADPYHTWRKDYLPIFQYVLLLRASAMRLSSILASTCLNDVRLLDVRDEWMAFRNAVDLRFISYKWLPNEMFAKMIAGTNTVHEIHQADDRLERIVQRFKERRDRNLVRVGLILAALLIVGLFVFSGA